MVEPKQTREEAEAAKEAWERAGRPRPETSVERATREARERGYPLPTRPDINAYLRELYKIYDQLVREGVLYPGTRDEYWERTYDYIKEHGLTPALPYYGRIQEEATAKKFGEEWGDYEKLVLEYGGTYEEKLGALLEAHPQSGDLKVYYGLKHKVWGSLGPEERKERERRRPRGVRELPAPQRAPYVTPFAYEPAFEAIRGGLAGPQPWKDWFERMYGTLIRRYKGVEAGPPPVGWAEYLKEQRPKLREEWWSGGAYGRGERPGAFAPKIRTVAF